VVEICLDDEKNLMDGCTVKVMVVAPKDESAS
jgi:hypothetical protein